MRHQDQCAMDYARSAVEISKLFDNLSQCATNHSLYMLYKGT